MNEESAPFSRSLAVLPLVREMHLPRPEGNGAHPGGCHGRIDSTEGDPGDGLRLPCRRLWRDSLLRQRRLSGRGEIKVRYDNDTTETFRLTNRAATNVGRDVNDAEHPRVVVYYTSNRGVKEAHYFRKK